MSDVEIFRRLRALEAAQAQLRALEYTPRRGTWTPIFSGTGGAGSLTYSRQNGRWARFANVVFAWCNQLLVSAVTSAPTGNLVIDGLPFTARNELNFSQGGAIHQFNNLNLTAGCIDLTLLIAEGNNEVGLIENFDNANASALPGSAITVGSFISCLIIYEADE